MNDSNDEARMALDCWARLAVRGMLIRCLLTMSNDFALMAKLAGRR